MMAAGNPSWWSMNPPSQQHSSNMFTAPTSPSLHSPQYVVGSSTALLPNYLPDHFQEFPVQSWSQLLLGGLYGEEVRFGPSHYQPKKLEIWESQILNPSPRVPLVIDVKQEITQNSNLLGHSNDEFQAYAAAPSQIMPVSPPRSCITNLSSNNILELTYHKAVDHETTVNQPGLNHSSECNSIATGRVCKKARVQPTSSSRQPLLNVRKEKLGDRITTLHQLVSPFGKTDTASVLLEVIGYIRFLHDQIEALSSPYLGSASPNVRNQQSDKPEDLRSRGLCLVPVSCTTHHAETDNDGAQYWAPTFGGGGI
ncbi:Peroxisome assembly protein 2 [Hibiscus syriacus]|uniref:Peroxisome assembly protein 2 n=1 Tax=Hibiscus syriacus TaxID=106335 RepID=A0A6A2XBM4_HIBSY|nr:transcription factor bHLH68-like [Hibiscus syriacus]KAE8659526.1 Peroxisome assembly protein 2 [Hibiscus syriacus]